MNQNNTLTNDMDAGAIGYRLSFDIGIPMNFPEIISMAVADELREMLARELTETPVKVIRVGLFSGQIPEAKDVTARIEARVIAARESESPGYEFLRGIGWHPEKILAQADYDAASERARRTA